MIVVVDGKEIDTSVVVDEEELTLDTMDGFLDDEDNDSLEQTKEFHFEDLEDTQEFIDLEQTLNLGEYLDDEQ